jgi:hypothetical protein
MTRWVLIVGAVLGCGVAALVAWGQPTNCTFPAPPDAITYVAEPGKVIPSAIWNQLTCIVNRLSTRVAATPRADVHCAQTSGVAPGARFSWTVHSTTQLTGTEAVHVNVLDTVSPPRVEPSGWSYASGNTVRVWVWNHDPVSTRYVKICVDIVKP